MFVFILVFSQIKAPLQQLSHGYESSCKYQSMAKVSELFSEGRRKRHLSETLSGKYIVLMIQFYWIGFFFKCTCQHH